MMDGNHDRVLGHHGNDWALLRSPTSRRRTSITCVCRSSGRRWPSSRADATRT